MRNKKQIFAIALLVVFVGGFVVLSMIDGFKKTSEPPSKRNKPNSTSTPYEPKFTKEGELWMIDPNTNDTIQKLDIEYAETAYEVETGMMYRKSVPKNTGMLFVFNDNTPRSFWMHNTYVPLDIIYISKDSTIVSIQKNAEPLNDRSLPSEGNAQFVLEIKGGQSDLLGIGKGTKMIFRKTDS